MITLQKDEKIQMIVRKHWFVFFADIISMIFVLLVPIGLAMVLYYLHTYITLSGNILALFTVVTSLLMLFVWLTIFVIWTDYYLDILILTNKHIIDVEQKGLFSRELSSFRIDKMQDVTSEVNGIIPTFLKFGTIHIQTAGEDREFIVHGVPKPYDLRHAITKLQNTALEEQRTVTVSDESLQKMKRT
jgi:membrane protein YdbS with pleckstrin-like domain